MFRSAPFVLGFTAIFLGALGSAEAHSLLSKPVPLTQDDNAKSGPCGCYFGAGPEDPAEDASPSACPGTFTTTDLVAGGQYTVEWLETVNHNGSFRLSISTKAPNAVTRADFNDPANVIYDEPDANGTSGGKLSTVITVPNTPCDSCTLQLRQFMSGATTPYYYSCANVRIVDPNATTSSSSTSAGAGGATGAGGASGAGGTSSTGASNGPEPSTGAGEATPHPSFDTGSCSIEAAGAERTLPFALAALVPLLLRRRRSR